MAIIEIKNLIKNFNNGQITTYVLKGINLNIEKGDFLLITGTSGSGKTTLINCISGLETITSGEVLIEGFDLSKISAKEMANLRKHKISFVFQTYNLLPNLTVYENILIASLIANGNKKTDEDVKLNERLKIYELLKKFNLFAFKDYFPNQISGGMQQRCAIVRALINDPEIIFADEPTGNLDSKSGEEVMKTLSYLHQEFGKTIVMVTHSLDHLKYANRHVQLIDGEIISDERL